MLSMLLFVSKFILFLCVRKFVPLCTNSLLPIIGLYAMILITLLFQRFVSIFGRRVSWRTWKIDYLACTVELYVFGNFLTLQWVFIDRFLSDRRHAHCKTHSYPIHFLPVVAIKINWCTFASAVCECTQTLNFQDLKQHKINFARFNLCSTFTFALTAWWMLL